MKMMGIKPILEAIGCFMKKETISDTRIIKLNGNRDRAHTSSSSMIQVIETALGKDNTVSSTKYNVINFLPKVIALQYRRLANIYFTSIIIIMLLGFKTKFYMSPLPPWGTAGTLVFIMALNIATEALDDYNRGKQDRLINTRTTSKVTSVGDEETVTWGELQPGQVIKIYEDEEVPADVLLLCIAPKVNDFDVSSLGSAIDLRSIQSESNVTCYSETSNIDGETNLKPRTVAAGFENLFISQEACSRTRGDIEVPLPSPLLSFEGIYYPGGKVIQDETVEQFQSGHIETTASEATERWDDMENFEEAEIPVGFDNLLLRGSILRNTGWVIGVVVYSGSDAKVLQSQRAAPTKQSKTEKLVNQIIVQILIIYALIVFITTVLQFGNQKYTYDTRYFQGADIKGRFLFPAFLASTFLFLILYKNILPILLYVAMEICNKFLTRQIATDKLMLDEETGVQALCRTTGLVTEIGQVNWIFSDKTGTLTENKMRLVAFATKTKNYGAQQLHELADLPPGDEGTMKLFSSALKERDTNNNVVQLVLALSLCHTVVVHTKTDTSTKPDVHSVLQRPSLKPKAPIHQPVDRPIHRRSLSTPFLMRGESNRKQLPKKRSAGPGMTRGFHSSRKLGYHGRAESMHDFQFEQEHTQFDYNAESPDELALVKAARNLGISFLGTDNGVTNINVYPVEQSLDPSIPVKVDQMGSPIRRRWKLLAVNAFSSHRKRMSVMYRDLDSGVGYVFVKGADERVLPLCNLSKEENQATLKRLKDYANIGLRTLVVAQRNISNQEITNWLNQLSKAKQLFGEEREAKLDSLANKLERNLNMLGVTAIEDRLQKGVPETIYKIREAGVPLWVLTGDKVETAINIGYSSQLIDSDSAICRVVSSEHADRESLLSQLNRIGDDLERKSESSSTSSEKSSSQEDEIRVVLSTTEVESTDVSILANPELDLESDFNKSKDEQDNTVLVVDGKALEQLLATELGNETSQASLLRTSRKCKVVIACRVSPAQKGALVDMVQYGVKPKPVTMAIGDGANDVAMIQNASIGVGLSGLEGNQAANSSDFSIAQFRFLQRLLFVHGRLNYIRMSKVITMVIYCNLLFTFTSFNFNYYCSFSGQPLFNELWYTMWNFFVAVPTLIIGFYDHDVCNEQLIDNPALYRIGPSNELLDESKMVGNTLRAIGHSMILFLFIVLLDPTIPLDALGGTLYLALVGVICLRCVYVSDAITRPLVASIFVNIGMALICVAVINQAIQYNDMIFNWIGAYYTWFQVMLCICLVLCADTLSETALEYMRSRSNMIDRQQNRTWIFVVVLVLLFALVYLYTEGVRNPKY